MEEKEEIQQNELPHHNEEEKPNSCDETTPENEQSQRRDDAKEARIKPENNQNPVLEGENGGESTKLATAKPEVSPRKPKAVSKQNQSQKGKHTVPQPFSLATEKRVSRERRGGGGAPPAHPIPSYSKSANLSLKVERHSSKTTPKPGDRAEKRVEGGHKARERVQAKEVEAKKSQAIDKRENNKQEEESEIRNLRKSSTFKAIPLPSFYHKKAPPPKPELKKIPSTRPKSPPLHRRSQSVSETSSHARSRSISEPVSYKIETINRSISVSEAGNGKTESVSSRSVSKTTSSLTISVSESKSTKTMTKSISGSAKDAINRLLRASWKAPTTQRKVSSAKGNKSCGVGAEVEKGAVSADEGKSVIVS